MHYLAKTKPVNAGTAANLQAFFSGITGWIIFLNPLTTPWHWTALRVKIRNSNQTNECFGV